MGVQMNSDPRSRLLDAADLLADSGFENESHVLRSAAREQELAQKRSECEQLRKRLVNAADFLGEHGFDDVGRILIALESGARKALEELKTAEDDSVDAEVAHGAADDALCVLLSAIGCADVVHEWQKIEKWYA